MYTSGDVERLYDPVSLNGVPFCMEQGLYLYSRGNKPEGLRYLKEIRLLADYDVRANGPAREAVSAIIKIRDKEKDRFDAIDHQSEPSLIVHNAKTIVYHEWMGYQFSVDGECVVLKRNTVEREGYAHDGILYGLSADVQSKSYDAVISVDTENFRYKILTCAKLEEMWQNKSPHNAITRTVITKNEYRAVYQFTEGAPFQYSGYEIFQVKGKRGLRVRIFTPEKSFAANSAMMKKIADGLMVNEHIKKK